MPANPHNPAQTTQRQDGRDRARERRIELVIQRLPERLQRLVRRLREPSARWMRIPVSVLLILCGIGGIPPILGLSMLPLGLALLGEDVPPLRRAFDRVLIWIERRRPHWLGLPRDGTRTTDAPSHGDPA